MGSVKFGIKDKKYTDDYGNIVTKKQLCKAIDKRFNGDYDKLLEYFLEVIDYSLVARKWTIRDFFGGESQRDY